MAAWAVERNALHFWRGAPTFCIVQQQHNCSWCDPTGAPSSGSSTRIQEEGPCPSVSPVFFYQFSGFDHSDWSPLFSPALSANSSLLQRCQISHHTHWTSPLLGPNPCSPSMMNASDRLHRLHAGERDFFFLTLAEKGEKALFHCRVEPQRLYMVGCISRQLVIDVLCHRTLTYLFLDLLLECGLPTKSLPLRPR